MTQANWFEPIFNTGVADEELSPAVGVLSYQRQGAVLVIEDEETLCRALSLRLRYHGFEVASASDGMEGLSKYYEFEPDVIVLDLGLPRLHGFKLLGELRKQPNLEAARVIVITGDPSPDLEERAAARGVSRVFRKPVGLRRLVQAVREELESC